MDEYIEDRFKTNNSKYINHRSLPSDLVSQRQKGSSSSDYPLESLRKKHFIQHMCVKKRENTLSDHALERENLHENCVGFDQRQIETFKQKKGKRFNIFKRRFSMLRRNLMRRRTKANCCTLKVKAVSVQSEMNEKRSKIFHEESPSQTLYWRAKCLYGKSLLIPDLNLNPSKKTMFATHSTDATKDDYSDKEGENTNLKDVMTENESEYFEAESKMEKLLTVSPKHLRAVDKPSSVETNIFTSLSKLREKIDLTDGCKADNAVPAMTKRPITRLYKQISNTVDSSNYKFSNVKSNYEKRIERKIPSSSTKTRKSEESFQRKTFNTEVTRLEPFERETIKNEVIVEDVIVARTLKNNTSPWSQVSKKLISMTSHESVRMKILFKNGNCINEISSDQRRRRTKICEEKTSLLQSVPKRSTSSYIPLTQNEHIEHSALRIYVLSMFCAVTCMQSIVSSSWSSITDSLMFAYPECKARCISLLSHWGSLSLLVSIFPACCLLHKKGLRTSLLVACGLCTLGTGVRCIHARPEHFIFLAHIGSILNGIGGVVYGPAIVSLSSTWFPANERTFATSVGTSLSMLGSATAYYLGPLIISDPNMLIYDEEDEFVSEEIFYDNVQRLIQNEISEYMLCCFLSQVCFYLILVLFFPEKPRFPTSKASSVSLALKIKGMECLQSIIKNRQLLLLSISSALLNGVATPWLSLLSMTLTPLNISQSMTAHIGFWTIICGCILSLAVSKLSDWYPGYLKGFLVAFGLLSTVMFTWMSLMIAQLVPYSSNKLLLAIMIGISSVWATSPLFYELGAELSYPASESIVTGFIFLITNLTVSIFNAFIYFFYTSNIMWLSYTLGLFSLASTICLCLVKPVYMRSLIDLPGG